MFANHARPALTLSLLTLLVVGTPLAALAQYRQHGAASNPNLRRPVPVAARSLGRPAGVAPASRQVPIEPELDSTGRLPPAALSADPEEIQPRRVRSEIVVPEASSSEVYYDPTMSGGYETYGATGGYFQPNMWAPPLMPMLGSLNLSVRGEFLYWWTSPLNTPVLGTTAPANVAVGDAGVLGVAGTSALLGTQLNDGARPGARFTANLWFDPCQKSGVEASYAFLGVEDTDYAVSSDRLPVIARPFFNVETGAQDAELVAFPNQLTGSLGIAASTMFHTGDIAYRWNLCCDSCRRVDMFVGYRFAYMKDSIAIREQLTSTNLTSGIVPGTTIIVNDSFEAANYFNGIELGVALQRQTFLGCVDGWLKTSLGNTHTQSTIAGSTVTTVDDQSVMTNEGFLALPTNIGQRKRDEFSTLVELGGKWNYDICNWRASVGYTLLFWSCIGRGGDLIDTEVNTSQLPPGPLDGAPSPRFQDRQSCFWAQGVTFGLERCW